MAARGVALLLMAGLALAQAAFQPQVQLKYKTRALTFAIIGDWGRIGGEYSDGTLATCKKLAAEFVANSSAAGDDAEGNSCGGLEQLKAAELMDQVCKDRRCQFVVNTGDNFYINGCYADDNTNVNASLRCAHRFKTDWENVYNSAERQTIKGLKWLNSLGNHDVLGLMGGVDAQIDYHKTNPNWILPARWYAADVSSRKTSVRFHVAHTSCFVSKYRKAGNSYNVDEVLNCASSAKVAEQVQFLNDSMASSTADWDIVLAHHPAISATDTSYFDPAQKPSAGDDGWGPLAQLVSQHSPAAYLNGHDHALGFQYAPEATKSGKTTLSSGYPKTGFYTSGAGSWPQAADGGLGQPYPNSFAKWSNVDLLSGFAYSGFAIANVNAERLVVDYYSLNNGKTIPLRVVTYKGMAPIVQFAPKGLDAVDLQNKVQMNQDDSNAAGIPGSWNGWRKML